MPSLVDCGTAIMRFFATTVALASPVGGALFGTFIGARAAIIGSIMGCG
jgi:uncharacterized membrane protein YdjX (TVP38/TMEM64 family)